MAKKRPKGEDLGGESDFPPSEESGSGTVENEPTESNEADTPDPVSKPSMPTIPTEPKPNGTVGPKPPPDPGDEVPTYIGVNGIIVHDTTGISPATPDGPEVPYGNITLTNPDGTPVTEADGRTPVIIDVKDVDEAGEAAAADLLRPGAAEKFLGSMADKLTPDVLKALKDAVSDPKADQAAKDAAAKKLWHEYLRKNDMDPGKALADLTGGGIQNKPPTGPGAPQPKPKDTPPPETKEWTGKGNGEGNGTVSASTAPAPAVKTEAEKAQEAVFELQNKEKQRFDDLVKLYNPNARGFSPMNPASASTPKELEAIQKMNDLIALSAKSGAIGDKAKADLSNLTKLTPENRDAWLKYYNPSAGVASGASASAGTASASQGQATFASMAPTEVGEVAQATGQYQTDLSPLTSYDSNIARSDQRARSVGLADMMEARARGEIPSVAAEQYKVGLDRLLQSQQAAVASQRGPASALALRGAQTQAGQLGQQAVRETAILRLQEQKEAEERAAAQSNLIMIEDQKLASAEKVNELNQRIQIVSADLQNTRNILDRDIFNAEAMNKVNMLEAQLRTDVESLNAELGTRASLTNAELATRASIANADNSTEASIASARNATEASVSSARNATELTMFAGTQAQNALRDQVNTERGDWTRGYDVTRDSLKDQQAALKDAAIMSSGMGANEIARQRLEADIANEADRRQRLDRAADTAQTNYWIDTGLKTFPYVAEAWKSSQEEEEEDWTTRYKKKIKKK